jgi:hypothetical protein
MPNGRSIRNYDAWKLASPYEVNERAPVWCEHAKCLVCGDPWSHEVSYRISKNCSRDAMKLCLSCQYKADGGL